MSKAPLDLAAVQEHLGSTQGRSYWRSLEELSQSADFQNFLHREFPRQASEWLPSMSRRNFLQLMGASLALAGVTACAPPRETIVPYVQAPEETVPGQSLFFATAMEMGGYAQGLLAQSQLNRPTKLEGNPDHPASLGATDAFAQASILTLYDPDRAQVVTTGGTASSWDEFWPALQSALAAQTASGGAGLRILSESSTSPTLQSQMAALLERFPNARWHQYEPVNRDQVYAGATLAFGQPVEPVYHFAQANVIVSLDADFLADAPGHVRYVRDFADGRRPAESTADRVRNRLYVIESTPTITGGTADHRLPLGAQQIEAFARALAAAVGVEVVVDAAELPSGWVEAIAADLQAAAGNGLMIVGESQPPIVHTLAHTINAALGSVGQTVTYHAPLVAQGTSQLLSLRELTEAMQGGSVESLLILGGNPVYNAPVDLDFATALAAVPFTAHLSLHVDETGQACQWQLPTTHYLEAWSDLRAYDGTITIQQPLIQPLYDCRSAHELLDALTSAADAALRSGHEIVQGYWQAQQGEGNFTAFWQRALHDGLIADSAQPAVEVTLQSDLTTQAPSPVDDSELTLLFRPDPTIWDGRFANNGWLQELPKPLTKLTWENAALISPATATRLGLADGDLVELTVDGRTVQAPILIAPGQVANEVTVHLGYGRTAAGRVGNGIGFNAYSLRTTDTPWFGARLTVRKVGSGYKLAITQDHHSMEGRELVRVGTVEQFAEDPGFVHALDPHHEELSLYPKVEYPENAWGMAIDMTGCIGCNACVVACQAENNIPIVGKDEVINGREMHWIRLDRYFEGEAENPAIHHQPVMCMHCENAPCEVVCPVAATMHDAEGLNTMVYNRCIGTRYCSNNCPYKVRRFNFLEYTDYDAESLKLQRNPNVTVRARGVMEKCTYCVQRISAARITAKLEGRPIADGEVVTACQGACPTKAIVFGNLNDPQSVVAQRKASPLNYGMLTELNTHPRTTYLAKLRNPNPALG